MLERELLLKLAAEYGTPLFVYDGDIRVPMGDGKGCFITVDDNDFIDGARVR